MSRITVNVTVEQEMSLDRLRGPLKARTREEVVQRLLDLAGRLSGGRAVERIDLAQAPGAAVTEGVARAAIAARRAAAEAAR